eukprot:CAMPEP_0198706390 /NCGR_PEP_ID=MMETSP1468-20131203/390937_1 /TAXON_ID=1461545 /ORGANISM="Mantoniella sp, Strain CCMP1436" /LENGTH=67 /DNA_ID=CAMNT_0044465327 /DNA_START=448 /DNA_END=651 /DNA_ORIENTATION=+
MRNFLRRMSARIIPGRMASRTSFTLSCSPTVSRPVHTPMDAFPKYMSGSPVLPPRPLTTDTCSSGDP